MFNDKYEYYFDYSQFQKRIYDDVLPQFHETIIKSFPFEKFFHARVQSSLKY